MNADPNKLSPPTLWKGQTLHFAGLVMLLAVTAFLWELLSRPHTWEFWLAVASPILHQVWVWVAWRNELNSSSISRSVGFAAYLWVCFSLFAGRFFTLALLAISDQGSLGLFPTILISLTVILLLLGLFAMINVKLYFGMSRAAGGDHFDQRFRDMPLVKEGIFRYTKNGMYVFAFLLFWAIAIGFNSASALVVAAFSHAYIWVHYYATEKPDMDFLYGSDNL